LANFVWIPSVPVTPFVRQRIRREHSGNPVI
jgi:hypothetical protein